MAGREEERRCFYLDTYPATPATHPPTYSASSQPPTLSTYLDGEVDEVAVLLDDLFHPGRLGKLLTSLLQMDGDLRPVYGERWVGGLGGWVGEFLAGLLQMDGDLGPVGEGGWVGRKKEGRVGGWVDEWTYPRPTSPPSQTPMS